MNSQSQTWAHGSKNDCVFNSGDRILRIQGNLFQIDTGRTRVRGSEQDTKERGGGMRGFKYAETQVHRTISEEGEGRAGEAHQGNHKGGRNTRNHRKQI